MAARVAQNDAAARAWINEHYGVMGSFLNHPEIGPILMKAGYDNAAFESVQVQIQSTNWWREHSDAQRKFMTLEQMDPAQANRLVWEKAADVKDMARSMGLSHVDVMTSARTAAMYGWSDAQLRDVLANQIDLQTATQTQGLAATVYANAKKVAAGYFVNANDGMNLEFARRVASGEMDEEDIATYYQSQAKELYAHLAPVIDQGVTLEQYFTPHRQELSKILEVAPDSIDFVNNKKYANILQTTGEDGKVRAMNLTEVGDYARQQDEWKHTENAVTAASDIAAQLSKTFGGIA